MRFLKVHFHVFLVGMDRYFSSGEEKMCMIFHQTQQACFVRHQNTFLSADRFICVCVPACVCVCFLLSASQASLIIID